jgi:serine protease Do
LFDNLIRQYKVGGEAELEGVRSGQPLALAVKLGRQPKPNSELEEHKDDRFEFTAREMSLSERVNAKLQEAEKGVRLASVQSAGWTALAGLSSGDILFSIDGQPVDSIKALKDIMTRLHEAKPRRVVFFVKRGIHTLFAEVEPKW